MTGRLGEQLHRDGVDQRHEDFFEVEALNAVGRSTLSTEASATPAVPAAAPGAPTGLTATAGNAQVGLSWTAPASNGAAITGYSLYEGASAGNDTLTGLCTSTATSCTVTGLTNGASYFFVVRANKAWGSPPTATRPVPPRARACPVRRRGSPRPLATRRSR